MIRQASAWNSFWAALAERRIYPGAIFSPETNARIRKSYMAPQGAQRPTTTSPYYSLWQKWTPKGAVYFPAHGDTLRALLADGLRQTGADDLRMKIALLALIAERLQDQVEHLA